MQHVTKQRKPTAATKNLKKKAHKVSKRRIGTKIAVNAIKATHLDHGNPEADRQLNADFHNEDVVPIDFRAATLADSKLSRAIPTKFTKIVDTTLTNEDVNTKFATEEGIAAWEKAATIGARVSPVNVEAENDAYDFTSNATNHIGPAAIQYNIFNEDTQFPVSKRLIGPPGTMEEPTMVFSPKPYRTVGCVGTVDNPHPLGWFSMEGYLKHMCPSCGQIFQLTNDSDECDFSYVDKVNNMSHFTGH